jgi:lambda family phage portal protein
VEIKQKSKRGGARPNAGRKPKDPQNVSFEAARETGARARVFLTSLDPKREVTSYDRRKLLEAGRHAVNNSGLASRIVRGTARFAVGNGLVPQAQTSDAAWNKEAEQWFEDRYCNVPWAFDKAGRFDFYSAQTALIEAMLTDGEIFAQLARSESNSPMVRFITADHVYGSSDKDGSLDGVVVNEDGKALAFTVHKNSSDPRGDKVTKVPAEDMLHIFRPNRIGYLRGVSWLGTAVTRIQDMREMDDTELAAQRLNGKVAMTIESEAAGTIGLGSNLRKQAMADGTSIKIDELVPGVGTMQLRPGEKMQAHEFNRPNPNYLAWRESLARECAYSVGVSPEIIWNMAGVGGTASRQALIDADVFFGSLRLLIENNFCTRFWRFAIWDAIKTGQLRDPGKDWHRCAWTGPQKLTVDNGRDGRLRIEMVRAGLLSRRQYFNELGQDSDQQTEDIIRDYARRKKAIERIAIEEGVEIHEQEVFPPAPGSAPVVIEPPEKPDDEDPETGVDPAATEDPEDDL